MPLLLIIRHIIFIAFFITMGVRWIAFIPLLGGVFLLLYGSSINSSEGLVTRGGRNSFVNDYSLTISWIMIMIGIWGFLDIISVDSLYSGGWLMILNGILWIGSYITNYDEGKRIFHTGRYLASALFFLSIRQLLGPEMVVDFAFSWISITMALYAFLVFVLGAVGIVKDQRLNYPLFVLLNICILYLIYYYTQSTGGFSLMIAQAYLFAVYALIRRIYKNVGVKTVYHSKEDDLFHHILSGESILEFTSSESDFTPIEIVKDIHNFLDSMSSNTKWAMGFLNVILVVLQTMFFVWNIREGAVLVDHLWFWGAILFFFGSFVLLRTIGYAYKLQRIVAFILLNFGIYISIIARFGNDVLYLVAIGIVWTIVNSLLVFQLRFLDRYHWLTRQDIYYWIVGTALASLCNLYFMALLPLSLQLIFSLIFFYVGIQGFLMRYNLMSIKKIEQ